MKSLLSLLPAAGLGLLLGCLLPVTKPSQPAPAPAGAESSASRASAVAIEMPAGDRKTWAADYGTKNPQEFYRWLLKQNPQPEHELVCAFFHTWIQSDPDAAFAAALRLPARFGFAPMTERSAFDANADGGFFITEAKALLDTNPAAAFRWIGRIDGVLGAWGTMNFITPFENHPDLKPQDVANALNQNLGGGFASTMANSYANFLLRKRGLDECLAWMRTLNSEFQNAVLEAVAPEWGKADPAGVTRYLQEASSPIRQYRALYLLSVMAGDSPAETIGWLERNMGVTSFTGLCNLLGSYDAHDPDGAQKYVMNLEDPAQRLDAIKGLGEAHTMRSSVPETLGWIASLPPEMQVEATEGAMRWRLDSDYANFMAPLADGSLAPEIQDRYIRQLAGRLSQGMMWDGKGAIPKWLEANPGQARDAFVTAGAEALKAKPEDRSKFLSYLPATEVKRILGEKP